MKDLKSKAKSTINTAASTAKRATEQVIDRSREAAHAAGKTMVKQGKKLRSV